MEFLTITPLKIVVFAETAEREEVIRNIVLKNKSAVKKLQNALK